MHGRHRAKDAIGHIQCGAGERVDRLHEGRNGSIHIRLKTERVQQVEAARLSRYIRGGITKPEVRDDVLPLILGFDTTRTVLQESINHHPIEAGDGCVLLIPAIRRGC
jgi:hypothetical protein